MTYDVLTIKERKLSCSELETFTASACHKGYAVHCQPGYASKDRYKNKLPQGGVVALVARPVQFQCAIALDSPLGSGLKVAGLSTSILDLMAIARFMLRETLSSSSRLALIPPFSA